MDKGLFIRELAAQLGVTGDTIINWEIRGMVPRIRSIREKLAKEVEGARKFL